MNAITLFPFPEPSTKANETELIIDSFAGGGGASFGIEMALGRSPDYAINHDREAIAMHRANHPETIHLSKNIWHVDPMDVVGHRPVGLLWASPDCKDFSKAKGGKPIKRNIRDLAWSVVLWAKRARPRVIILENVEEFRKWGPLTLDGRRCKEREGQTFDKWVSELERLGYKVEWRELRARDYDTPTIRKRLYLIARRDGKPIVWPEPTHGAPDDLEVVAGVKKPFHTAAEIIDWDLPCPSIFDNSEDIKKKYGLRAQRPLADATMARIARGVKRYVLEAAQPFIVTCNHGGDWQRGWSINEPIKTMTAARDAHALVTPSVAPFVTYGQHGGNNRPASDPLHTIAASHKDQNAVVAPFLKMMRNSGKPTSALNEPTHTITAQGAWPAMVAPTLVQTGYGERNGQKPRALDLHKPIGTQVSGASKHALVAGFLAKHNTGATGSALNEPVHTIVANGAGKREGGASPLALVTANMLNLRGSKRRDADVRSPLNTVSAGGNHSAVIASHITRQFGNSVGSDSQEPIGTITAGGGGKSGLVAAFLQTYYGTDQSSQLTEPLPTDTTKDRFSLVTVEIQGQTFVIEDIGMRMLTPRERFRAQGFPDSYKIDTGVDENGKEMKLSQAAQGRMCGNSVCPPVAAALVTANVPEMAAQVIAA